MAVTNEYSTQAANVVAVPPVNNPVDEQGGRVRIAVGNFTQGVAAGDAGSTGVLVSLPAGARVLPEVSGGNFSAFGAGRTIDIGFVGYTLSDGTAVTAVADKFLDGADVSAAGKFNFGAGTNANQTSHKFDKQIREGRVLLRFVVAGGTIPAGATVNAFVAYTVD